MKYLCIYFCLWCACLCSADKMYFATAADTEFYPWLLNLIASIHRHNHLRLGEIAVFDLGLVEQEKAFLQNLDRVNVYPVENVHPDMLKKFKIRNDGKSARGWYSWKPVVLKQALDHFPEVLYLDAGIILTGPSDALFQHLHEQGYLFLDCGHTIQRMATEPVIKHFQLEDQERQKFLNKLGLSAGFQGVSRALLKEYILPLYELAKQFTLFVDDGSAPKGFGWSRHDQSLFSIQARLSVFYISEGIRNDKLTLFLEGKKKTFSSKKFLLFSRGDQDAGALQFLRFKN